MNRGLGQVRRWRSADLFDRLAAAHLRLLENSERWKRSAIDWSEESKPILELAAGSEDVEVFKTALEELSTPPKRDLERP
jgi:hypothetical protein